MAYQNDYLPYDSQGSATGRAFLLKMAPPRPRTVQAFDERFAPQPATSANGDQKQQVKTALKAESAEERVGGSTPSIPSSITHPSSRVRAETFGKPEAKRRALWRRPSTATEPAPPPIAPVTPVPTIANGSNDGSTTFHGAAAFAALEDLDIFTPSLQLGLRFDKGKITCIFTGFLASHQFDDALRKRVETIMKSLKQETLGQPVSDKIIAGRMRAIADLKKADGNTAIVVSRIVGVVMRLFDYARVEDVVVRIEKTEAGLVTVTLKGLKWAQWNNFTMKCGGGFKAAFSKDGKMTGQEEQ